MPSVSDECGGPTAEKGLGAELRLNGTAGGVPLRPSVRPRVLGLAQASCTES